MEISTQIAEQILNQILAAQNIIIISHRNPDADTIGSNLALKLIFQKYNKSITSACVDIIPSGCHFLPYAKDYLTDFNPADYDLFISVDAGSEAQTGFLTKYPNLKSIAKNWINIDHHASNNGYGSINLVKEHAASATLVLYHLFKIWEQPITAEIATCLLAGLYFDTGSFMHSNTDEDVLETASALLKLGAKQCLIVKNLFKNQSIEQMHLWGKVLSETRLTDNKVAVAGVKSKDLEDHNATTEELSGLIDYLSMVKGNDFAALLTEDGKGNIKGSFRTRKNDINLSEIASNFGGGGHKKASGFTMKGQLEKETRLIIKPS